VKDNRVPTASRCRT